MSRDSLGLEITTVTLIRGPLIAPALCLTIALKSPARPYPLLNVVPYRTHFYDRYPRRDNFVRSRPPAPVQIDRGGTITPWIVSNGTKRRFNGRRCFSSLALWLCGRRIAPSTNSLQLLDLQLFWTTFSSSKRA